MLKYYLERGVFKLEIIARNVKKNIKDKSILKNITLSVKTGETYGLIGPNGAGKSTFMRCLIGIFDKTSGELSIDGITTNSENFDQVKSQIGCIFDNLGLYEDFTVWENLEFFHKIFFHEASKPQRSEDIEKVLNEVALIDKKNTKVRVLSNGEKQRLVFARALINNPRLLVLDEPTVSLDVDWKLFLREYIKKAKARGITVFISSHDLTELEQICDKYGFIKDGVLIREEEHNDRDNQDLESIYKSVFDLN